MASTTSGKRGVVALASIYTRRIGLSPCQDCTWKRDFPPNLNIPSADSTHCDIRYRGWSGTVPSRSEPQGSGLTDSPRAEEQKPATDPADKRVSITNAGRVCVCRDSSRRAASVIPQMNIGPTSRLPEVPVVPRRSLLRGPTNSVGSGQMLLPIRGVPLLPGDVRCLLPQSIVPIVERSLDSQ